MDPASHGVGLQPHPYPDQGRQMKSRDLELNVYCAVCGHEFDVDYRGEDVRVLELNVPRLPQLKITGVEMVRFDCPGGHTMLLMSTDHVPPPGDKPNAES